MKHTKGFTLVEILIVIVIVGVLSTTLLPKLIGITEKTRDIKRKTDLRTIGTAIEMYQTHHGELPFWNNGTSDGKIVSRNNFRRNADDLKELLHPYLSSIPKDPSSKNNIDLCPGKEKKSDYWIDCESGKKRGSYLYFIYRKRKHASPITEGNDAAALIAKVETADNANFVLVTHELKRTEGNKPGYALGHGLGGGPLYPRWVGESLQLCSSIEKGGKTERKQKGDGTYDCTYTSQDQLYYIFKIE